MINTVVSSVCGAIYDCFKDDYKIYKELVKQDLNNPCFFVECEKETRTQQLNYRYFRQHAIAIYYFPEKENFRAECNDVFNKLRYALEYVNVDGSLVRTKNLRFEYTDAKKNRGEYSHVILKVLVDLDFFTYENLDYSTYMQDFFFEGGVLDV